MKQHLLAGISLFALGSAVPAAAADLPVRGVAAPAAIQNWTGFYIGAHAGWGWGDADWLNITNTTAFGDAVPGRTFSHRVDGFLAGGQAGFNWQTGMWVFGVEASLSGADIDGGLTSFFGSGRDDVFRTELDTLFLLTGRVGVALQNWLLYVNGGYASGRVHTSVTDVLPPSTGSGSHSRWLSGWTLGAGIEWGFLPNWSLAVQYNWVSLEDRNFELAGGTVGSYLWNVDLDELHIVTARLNWRFPVAGPAAVVARD